MLPTPGSDALIGQRLLHYRISARLGAGGMGVVYKATDEKLGRPVALKFLPPDTTGGAERRRFIQEARAASALDHPNVGVIHGVEETSDGKIFIVMAFYDGETLAGKVRRGPLSEAQAVDIAIQMAQGLAHAHARSIVHRDIKPANVIITSPGLVKLLDFGLAKIFESDTQTQTGAVVGTPSYMSPEQALGQTVDHRTDIWSAGVVLYEMLTGVRPFARDNTPSTLLAITADPPPELHNVQPALQTIVYRCLAKEPKKRYPDASQLATELEKARGSPPPWVPTVTLRSREVRSAREAAGTQAAGLRLSSAARPRRVRWVAAAAILTLAAAGTWYGLGRRAGSLVPGERHVAVLPFANLGGDPALAPLCDGILETLTSRLSGLDSAQKSLWIAPASEVRRRNVNDAEAARRVLGSNLVVTGGVQKDASGVRLTVNLIDTRTFRQLGSAVLDDRSGNFSSLEDNAVATLAKMLRVELNPGEAQKANGETATPAAYESYLKGLGLLQRWDKPGNLDSAIQLLHEAVTADPRFALAYARMAEAERLKYHETRNQAALDRAMADAQRASEIDDQLAPVHVILGQIHSEAGHYDLAVQELQRALKLDPRNAEAYERLSGVLQAQGRFEEAEANMKQSVALRPDFWSGYNTLGVFYYNRGRYGEAAAQFRKVIELTPDNSGAYLNLGVILNRLNDSDGARQAYEKSIAITPSYAAYSNLAGLYFESGEYARAAAAYEKAIQMNDRNYRPWAGLALADRAAGLPDKARPALEKALALAEDEASKKPNDPVIQSDLASYYAKQGDGEKARRHIGTALALAPQDRRISYMAALVYEALGDRQGALKWLKTALGQGYPLNSVQKDPELKALRGDPAFRALVAIN